MNWASKAQSQRAVGLVLVIVAGALTLLAAGRWVGQMFDRPRVSDLVETAAADQPVDLKKKANEEGSEEKPANGKDQSDPHEQLVKMLTGRNLFVIDTSTPPSLIGVLGDEALFEEDQSGRKGDTVKGAKILEIGSDWVEIEFKGKKQKLQVFEGQLNMAQAPSPPRPGRVVRSAPPTVASAPPEAPSGMPRSLDDLPPEVRRRFDLLPPEVQQRIRERMRSRQ